MNHRAARAVGQGAESAIESRRMLNSHVTILHSKPLSQVCERNTVFEPATSGCRATSRFPGLRTSLAIGTYGHLDVADMRAALAKLPAVSGPTVDAVGTRCYCAAAASRCCRHLLDCPVR
jgi:hypothetical protein